MRIAMLAVLALTTPAAAAPCAPFGLAPRVLNANPVVTTDGGIVVGELPHQQQPDHVAPDASTWQVRASSKRSRPTVDAIAPGLAVYRPPAGAVTFTLEDDKQKPAVLAKAKLATDKLETLPAPRVVAIVSGTTTGARHPSTFVRVELDGAAPKGAVVLVVSEAKGPARSWGAVGDGDASVEVYSTGGGCITRFPNGTVISQPGDRVVAFWVDGAGRRSPQSPPVIVTKPK